MHIPTQAEALTLWHPPSISEDLATYAQMFAEGKTHVGMYPVDELLAQALAKETQRHFKVQGGEDDNGNPKSPIYRAEKAASEKYKVGNCFAHTEGTASIGMSLGLNMRIQYNGKHASCLWYTEDQVRTIDGEIGFGYKPYYDSESRVTQHLLADMMAGGRMLVGQEPITSEDRTSKLQRVTDVNFKPVYNVLGEVTVPLGYKIVLPVDEGMLMLNAVGDQLRYRSLDRTIDLERNADRFAELIPTFMVESSQSTIPAVTVG